MGLTKKQKQMIAVLVIAAFVMILNQTIVNPVLPAVMRDMKVDASVAQWLSSGFTLVNAIMVPITAYLIDRFGPRALVLFSMTMFAIGSALCGWGPTFGLLLAGRVVQAVGAGILMPLVMVVMMLVFPVQRRGTALGLFSVVVAFAPAIGPTVGGIVIDLFSWHWLFRGVFFLALLIFLGAPFVTTQGKNSSPKPDLDMLSVILSTLGFGGLLYAFSTIAEGQISATNLLGGVVGLGFTIWFFIRQMHLETPLVQVRILKVSEFSVSTAVGMLIQAFLLSTAILMPIYVQQIRGLSATVSGVLILPGAILMGIMGPVTGRIFDRHGARTISIIGAALMAFTAVAFCFINLETSLIYIGGLYVVRMFGVALVNMPINTWGMNALDNKVINHGTSLSNTMRQVAGSFGTALLVSVMHFVTTHMQGVSANEASLRGIQAAFAASFLLALAALILIVVRVHDRPRAVDTLAESAN